MNQTEAMKLAKEFIRKKPMPASLEQCFKEHGLEYLLDDVYRCSAELIAENENASDGVKMHLKQILPSIAFYEVLLEKEKDEEAALAIFESWCFQKIEKMAGMIPKMMKIPGLYKVAPKLMRLMLDKMFGEKCGFRYRNVEQENGFAVDMTVCPYVETCKKYGHPELAQFFCKSDDICYGNMHPKLVWGRTKTLGTGGDCCDFKLYIKQEDI